MHGSTRLGVPLITLVLLASSGIASAQDGAASVTGTIQPVDGSCSRLAAEVMSRSATAPTSAPMPGPPATHA